VSKLVKSFHWESGGGVDHGAKGNDGFAGGGNRNMALAVKRWSLQPHYCETTRAAPS
jgi:hypothetical protein